jgi:integrase/recombinase XerD
MRPVFCQEEQLAHLIVALPDIRDPLGRRDRAIFEVFCATGIRRKERMNLKVFDLDSERGTLMVWQGKGKTDRLIPIERSPESTNTIEAWPKLVVEPDEGQLFFTELSECFTPNRLTQLVRNCIRDGDTGKSGSCHVFRHTMATRMLEHRANSRFIQQTLGHAEVSTTQMYTQVSIRQLQRVYELTHPGAKLESRADKQQVKVSEQDAEELLHEPAVESEEEDDESASVAEDTL